MQPITTSSIPYRILIPVSSTSRRRNRFSSMKLSFALILLIIPLTTGLFSKLRQRMGQTISTTQFYLHGRKQSTQTGYLKHVAKYTSPAQKEAAIRVGQEGADNVNLEGKVIIVTGANSGIGKEVATYAAAKGAKLYMLCRSKERAEKARDEIMKLTSNKDIKVVLADLAEMSEVRKVVEELQGMESKVDALVCNAGVLLNDRKESKEGNEITFASHFLGGSFLLSQLLLPQLKAAKDQSRVVFVSSGGMYTTKFPDWETATSTGKAKDKYDGNLAYAYAKRGQVLLAEQLTKDIPEVTWVSCHPGWTDTPAVDEAYGDSKKYLEPMRSTWEGAEGIAWLMGTDKKELESGAYYLDRKPQTKHLSGPFFSEGSFTKNSQNDIDVMMEMLKKTTGL